MGGCDPEGLRSPSPHLCVVLWLHDGEENVTCEMAVGQGLVTPCKLLMGLNKVNSSSSMSTGTMPFVWEPSGYVMAYLIHSLFPILSTLTEANDINHVCSIYVWGLELQALPIQSIIKNNTSLYT